MEIVSHLLELLEIRKSVGIQSLGILYKKKIPGRYDAQSHSFLPPSQELTFVDQRSDDLELANFIAKKNDISVEEACEQIEDFVKNIRFELSAYQQADFSPIGKLVVRDESTELEISADFAISPTFFGLPKVNVTPKDDAQTSSPAELQEEIPSIKVEKIEDVNIPLGYSDNELSDQNQANSTNHFTEEEEIQMSNEIEERIDLPEVNEWSALHDEAQPDTFSSSEIDLKEKNTPNLGNSNDEKDMSSQTKDINDPLWRPSVINRDEYEYDDDDELKGRRLKKILKGILIVLFVVGGIIATIYFFYPNLFYILQDKVRIERSEQQTEPTTEPKPSNNPAGPSVKIKKDADTVQQVAVKLIDTPKKKVILPTTPKSSSSASANLSYEVIGSAMKTQKKVDEVIRNFEKRGILAKQLDALPGRLIKVSLGSFSDFNAAKKYQDSLKTKLKNPDLYIQTIKPKN